MNSARASARQPSKPRSRSKSCANRCRTSNNQVELLVRRMRGNLYIVSAPSGSGKTTLLQNLLRAFKDLRFSVSYTTRNPRTGEQHGVDYFFVDRPTFLGMVERGEFLEWAEYYGQLYGTARAFVDGQLAD